MEPVPITFSYAPVAAPTPAAAAVAGGALLWVSPRAAAVIQAHRDPAVGRIDPAAAGLLAAVDEREGHATELGVLVRALARRAVFARVALSAN